AVIPETAHPVFALGPAVNIRDCLGCPDLTMRIDQCLHFPLPALFSRVPPIPTIGTFAIIDASTLSAERSSTVRSWTFRLPSAQVISFISSVIELSRLATLAPASSIAHRSPRRGSWLVTPTAPFPVWHL